jgi:ankyrin repeat protein
MLIEHGADVTAQNKEYENTPLHLALQRDKANSLACLLSTARM